jgi:hypothetical protein
MIMSTAAVTRAIVPKIACCRSIVSAASRHHRSSSWMPQQGVESGRSLATAAASSGGARLAELKVENPHVDVVQYAHKGRTWSIQQVDYYSEALAIGLAENGLISGDVVLSWLPSHFSEQVRT